MTRVMTSVVGACLAAIMIAYSAAALSGLSVGLSDGPGRAPVVLPGETYVQGIVVAAGSASADVLIEVLGYRQDAEKGVIPLAPEEDIGPRSARSFISPQTSSVHVAAGETKRIELRVSVPTDVGDGGRYALLRVSTQPQGQGTVGVVSAIVIPFTFTIKGSQLIHSGRITTLTVPTPESGKPVTVLITQKNTGNHHFKMRGRVLIKRSDGSVVGSSSIVVTSPIPDSSSQTAVEVLPGMDLSPGDYYAEATLSDEFGARLSDSSVSFHIAEKYTPPSPTAVPKATMSPAATSPQAPGVAWPVIIGLVAGALVLGSVGTLAATKRRRSY